jgi:molybdopterin-binding protein
MKKSSFNYFAGSFIILHLLLTSCVTSQSWVPVKGSGESRDKSYSVSDFQGIEVSGGFDVLLTQGNSEGLILTAQENLFDHITVEVEQGILKIYTENNIMATRPLKAMITYKSIEKLRVSGGGDVSFETPANVPELGVDLSGGGDIRALINTGRLECHISGGGDASLDGEIKSYNLDLSGGGDVTSVIKAGVISCSISGGGDITIRNGEKAAEVTIDINGGGDLEAEIQADRMKCSVSGGGNATLTGQAGEFEITINGGGDVNAGDLVTQTTSFIASGGSDIHVNASQELTGQISGGGDVYYEGGAEKVDIDARGGSEIHKR